METDQPAQLARVERSLAPEFLDDPEAAAVAESFVSPEHRIAGHRAILRWKP